MPEYCCSNCHSEWNTSKTITQCPFCGRNLPPLHSDYFSTSDMTELIELIKNRMGPEAFSKELFRKLHIKGAMLDYAPSLSREIKLMDIAVNADIYKVVFTDSQLKSSNIDRAKLVLKHDCFLSDQNIDLIIQWFRVIFNNSLDATKEKRKSEKDCSPTFVIKEYDNGIYKGYMLNGKPYGRGKYTWNDGTVYEGDYSNETGFKHGKGKLIETDGTIYEGDFKDGMKSGNGIQKNTDGRVYEGEFKNNNWNGKGKLTFPNGSIFEGVFADGEPIGVGKYTESNGDVYEGEWIDGIKHGKGKMIFNDGTVYEGEFYKGFMHGKGRIQYLSGAHYEGEFVENRKTGIGKLVLANGCSCEGKFINGIIFGYGIAKDNHGNVYKGFFENGKYHGKGRYEWTDGGVYEGEFKNGKRDGKGKLSFPNGLFYEGDFREDKYDGTGIIKFSNGNAYKGEFKNGKVNGVGTFTNNKGEIFEGEFINDTFNGVNIHELSLNERPKTNCIANPTNNGINEEIIKSSFLYDISRFEKEGDSISDYDLKDNISSLILLASQKNTIAQYFLAYCYENGIGVKESKNTSKKLYVESLESENPIPKAAQNLGLIYASEGEFNKSVDYLTTALQLGFPESALYLGQFYTFTASSTKDPKIIDKVLEYYRAGIDVMKPAKYTSAFSFLIDSYCCAVAGSLTAKKVYKLSCEKNIENDMIKQQTIEKKYLDYFNCFLNKQKEIESQLRKNLIFIKHNAIVKEMKGTVKEWLEDLKELEF